MELDPSGRHFIPDDADRLALILPPDCITIEVEVAPEFLGRAEAMREQLSALDTPEYFTGSMRQRSIELRQTCLTALDKMIKQFEAHIPSVADGADKFLQSLE